MDLRAERAAEWTEPGDTLDVGAAREAGMELNSTEAHKCWILHPSSQVTARGLSIGTVALQPCSLLPSHAASRLYFHSQFLLASWLPEGTVPTIQPRKLVIRLLNSNQTDKNYSNS